MSLSPSALHYIARGHARCSRHTVETDPQLILKCPYCEAINSIKKLDLSTEYNVRFVLEKLFELIDEQRRENESIAEEASLP